MTPEIEQQLKDALKAEDWSKLEALLQNPSIENKYINLIFKKACSHNQTKLITLLLSDQFNTQLKQSQIHSGIQKLTEQDLTQEVSKILKLICAMTGDNKPTALQVMEIYNKALFNSNYELLEFILNLPRSDLKDEIRHFFNIAISQVAGLGRTNDEKKLRVLKLFCDITGPNKPDAETMTDALQDVVRFRNIPATEILLQQPQAHFKTDKLNSLFERLLMTIDSVFFNPQAGLQILKLFFVLPVKDQLEAKPISDAYALACQYNDSELKNIIEPLLPNPPVQTPIERDPEPRSIPEDFPAGYNFRPIFPREPELEYPVPNPLPRMPEAPKPIPKGSCISMMVLGGFLTAIGIIAVALAFTALNIATVGVTGILILGGISAAGLLGGMGLFGAGLAKWQKAKAEPVIEPNANLNTNLSFV